METKNLNKIEIRRHVWNFGYNYNMTEMYWSMGFVVASLVFGTMACVAFYQVDVVWEYLALYACLLMLIPVFSIHMVKLIRGLNDMRVFADTVSKINAEEQRNLDYGVDVTYYDPISKVEISEERYDELRRAELEKEREETHKEIMRNGMEGEVKRKEMEKKRQENALEALRKSTVIVPHDLDAIRKGEEE